MIRFLYKFDDECKRLFVEGDSKNILAFLSCSFRLLERTKERTTICYHMFVLYCLAFCSCETNLLLAHSYSFRRFSPHPRSIFASTATLSYFLPLWLLLTLFPSFVFGVIDAYAWEWNDKRLKRRMQVRKLLDKRKSLKIRFGWCQATLFCARKPVTGKGFVS